MTRTLSAVRPRFAAWTILAVVGALLTLSAPRAAHTGPAPPLLIRDVRLLDLSGERARTTLHASVVVRDGKIAQVGKGLSPPAGAHVIEGAGRTLMPGLVDMHVHVWDEAELGGYLARGITTIRNASGMPFHLQLRDRIAAGTLEGPRLITTGPILNGQGPNAQINHMIVDTPDAARAAVRRQHAAGYRRLKVYSNLSRASYEAIRDEAAKLGMTIMGHPPEGVREPGMPKKRPFNIRFEELLDDGFVTIEHMESVIWHGLRNELDEDKARVLARKVAAAGVPIDPTLLAFYSLLRVAETKGAYLERPGVDRLNRLIVEQDGANYARWSGENAASARRYFEFYKRATKIFQDAGVLLVAGSDAGIFTNVPGDSLGVELRLLTEAGLTPHEALQAATWNAARALGESDRVGRIAPGYRADMILVAGDPLAEAALAARPSAVIAQGRYFDAADLRRLLAGAVDPSYERTQRNVMAGLAAQAG